MTTISLQCKNNAKLAKTIEKKYNIKIINDEVFKGKENNHKFKPGDTVVLFGLEDYPQFNGTIVTISSIRQDGQYGKAYYFSTDNEDLSNQLNWTYEYRLKLYKEV